MIIVPHFSQEKAKTCLPASIRMVLAYLGIQRSESEIAALMQSSSEGTSVMNVTFISKWGLEVWSGTLTPPTLKTYINQSIPVIVVVNLLSLDSSFESLASDENGERNHTLVVVGYDDSDILVNDALADSSQNPKRIKWSTFLKAWDDFGNFAAVIQKAQHADSQ
jgi:ABC-type bacteriocin/lantibiotic exporter with double-glycine peptidase domain